MEKGEARKAERRKIILRLEIESKQLDLEYDPDLTLHDGVLGKI